MIGPKVYIRFFVWISLFLLIGSCSGIRKSRGSVTSSNKTRDQNSVEEGVRDTSDLGKLQQFREEINSQDILIKNGALNKGVRALVYEELPIDIQREYVKTFLENVSWIDEQFRYGLVKSIWYITKPEYFDSTNLKLLGDLVRLDLRYIDELFPTCAIVELEEAYPIIREAFEKRTSELLFSGPRGPGPTPLDWKVWNAAGALTILGNKEAADFLIETYRQWLKKDKFFASTKLTDWVVNLKARPLIKVVIEELLYSDYCSPRELVFCDWYIASNQLYRVVKEYQTYSKSKYESDNIYPNKEEARAWFENHPNWTLIIGGPG